MAQSLTSPDEKVVHIELGGHQSPLRRITRVYLSDVYSWRVRAELANKSTKQNNKTCSGMADYLNCMKIHRFTFVRKKKLSLSVNILFSEKIKVSIVYGVMSVVNTFLIVDGHLWAGECPALSVGRYLPTSNYL